MNILYLGDIMGEPGMLAVERMLPGLIKKHQVDVVIAQSENVTNGKGMSPRDMRRLQKAGIDVFTGGNHSIERSDTQPLLKSTSSPVLAPANMHGNKGKAFYRHATPKGDVVVASILGTVFMKSQITMDNSLQQVDAILESITDKPAAIVMNIHGDYSSDKRAFGYFVDGRISLAVGDHWHVPTADAQILPKGTAYITDVGMCGTVHSILGVKTENILARMRDEVKNYNVIETEGPLQLCSVLTSIDTTTGLATAVEQIILNDAQP